MFVMERANIKERWAITAGSTINVGRVPGVTISAPFAMARDTEISVNVPERYEKETASSKTGFRFLFVCAIMGVRCKPNLFFWSMLFEKKQHLGDCSVTERLAAMSQNLSYD